MSLIWIISWSGLEISKSCDNSKGKMHGKFNIWVNHPHLWPSHSSALEWNGWPVGSPGCYGGQRVAMLYGWISDPFQGQRLLPSLVPLSSPPVDPCYSPWRQEAGCGVAASPNHRRQLCLCWLETPVVTTVPPRQHLE